MNNSDLLVCCNILNRVETLLQRGKRVQLSKESLTSISDYLTKAMKYIDPNISIFGNQLIVFGKSIESIDAILASGDVVAINIGTKEYLVDKLYSSIIEFKVNVGKYLTYNEFDYRPNMDTIIKDIIDTCIENKYYFDYDMKGE